MPVTDKQNRLSRRRVPAWVLPILAGLALWLAMPPAGAQSSPNPPVRLYIFDCGHLKSGNPEPLLKQGITTTDMSVAAYLIVHPRGTLLWDSGVIPDDLVKPGGTVEARATVHTTLKGQLAEIGYKPSDITYLALSHNHYDHSANANDYAGSTWLVQKPERDFMFPDTPPATPPNGAARYSGLKYSKTILLDGDYDVFGDGSVVIIATPGTHAGSSVFVRETGADRTRGAERRSVPLSVGTNHQGLHAFFEPWESGKGSGFESQARESSHREEGDTMDPARYSAIRRVEEVAGLL